VPDVVVQRPVVSARAWLGQIEVEFKHFAQSAQPEHGPVLTKDSTILEIYAVSLGLGQQPSFTALFVFVPLIITVMMVPVSISGLGLREGAFVVLFGLTGISAEASAAISFLWFLSVATGSLPGLFLYLRIQGSDPSS